MLIEAVRDPIRCRWPGGEVTLEPGQPVDLPEDRARKLLAKAGEKVRIVDLVVEPALPCKPVYWRSMNGQVHGPATVRLMAKMGRPGQDTFWLCVAEGGQTIWIQDTLLISRQTAEADQVRRSVERDPA